MQKKVRSVTIGEFEFQITFDYTPAVPGTQLDPPEAEEIEPYEFQLVAEDGTDVREASEFVESVPGLHEILAGLLAETMKGEAE